MTDRITVHYDPDKTQYGAKLKDKETGSTHFSRDVSLLEKVRAGDILDVVRKLRPENPEYPGNSYNITSWKVCDATRINHSDQKELPIRPPSPRPPTNPKDQRQMFVTALMKEWMAAYAQLQSVTTSGEMKPMDAGVVEQAARVCGTVYDRLFGPMTNRPQVDEDMNDEIGF